ncbi:MAG: reverse transcriptase-like protein [Candidatus Lokiarchaeota archaeon]|nr:reverse transcriptase-like protein [Candidatus Lokiarchaeota archaeon]
MKVLKIYTDGAARGNPGPAAIAYVFIEDNKILSSDCEYIGEATNNTAEYRAVLLALKNLKTLQYDLYRFHSDSQLVVNQINQKWKINKKHLKELYSKVRTLIKKLPRVEFEYVSRDNINIQKCDSLCNQCLDEKGK